MKNFIIKTLKRKLLKIKNKSIYKVNEKGFFSQYGQDTYIANTIFHNMKNGVFIDIGAHDGISISNSNYFEKELAWTGIAIEPHPDNYLKLQKNRGCITLQGCIADFDGDANFLSINGADDMLSGIVDKYDPKHIKRIDDSINKRGGTKTEITVKCFTLKTILNQYKFNKIDYLSIDTEGGEIEIIKSIDFKNIHINVISIENNYSSMEIRNHLNSAGFELIALAGCDEIYKSIEFQRNTE